MATSASASISRDLNAVVDHAVQAVGKAQGVQVDLPATGGGDGAMVDSAALDEITASITGKDGVLASTARHLLGQLGLTEPAVEESENLDAELVQLVESELGSDWARKVAPTFDERRAVLLDDRWASVREDFARVWVGDDEAREHSFAGLDEAAKSQAGWWLDRASREKRDDLVSFYDGALSASDDASSGATRWPWSPVPHPARSPALSSRTCSAAVRPSSRPRRGWTRSG